MSIEAIKTQLEVLGSLKVEFTPKSDEGNSIIVPIDEDYDGTFFTVIGCGDKQDNLGAYMALAVNELPDLIPEIDRLQRENAALREDRYKLAFAITGGEDAPGLLDSTPTSEIIEIAQHAHRMHQGDIDRAEAEEAEVERLQTELALSKPLYSRRQIEARVELLEAALKAWEAWEAKLILEGSDDLWDELGDLTELQALRNAALSAQVQDVAGWQPIETAPKDGTVILGGHEAAVITVWWEADGSQNNTGEPGWIDGAFNSVEENYTYPVTHWMPLPVFPASPAPKHGDAD